MQCFYFLRNLISQHALSKDLLFWLVNANLAKRKDADWFEVERSVSNILMTTLATLIGKEGEYTPATDSPIFINPHIIKYGVKNSPKVTVREQLLESILPIPNALDLDVKNLEKFKENHKEDLHNFRKNIELIINTISKIDNPEEQKEELDKHIKFIEEKKEFLSRKLNESFSKKVLEATISSFKIPTMLAISFNSTTPLVGGLIGSIFNSSKAILNNPIKSQDFAYLAFLDKRKL